MSGQEIKDKIDYNFSIIEEEAAMGLFTLSERSRQALKEIKKLKAQCIHEFDDSGICVYCGSESTI